MHPRCKAAIGLPFLAILAVGTTACSRGTSAEAREPQALVSVGVTKAHRMPLSRQLTLSSELVPFQEIDVYAKESGYVETLNVDYGTRVKKGQLMAVLEIPELQAQLQQDDAAIENMANQVTHAQHELGRVKAQHQVAHLQFQRLNEVAKAKPGLVAQQEVDDWQGKDLAAEAQVEATESALEAAQSQLSVAKAKLAHDQVLYSYSRITAPFDGVVTQRFANLGTLVQAGTSSSTQALPLVRLSQEDKFRLVIPVPESSVRFIRVGDPVEVRVPALNQSYPGRVARFSEDVKEDTRTMHTEVDVPNPDQKLVAGMYAEASLQLEHIPNALVVPLGAIDHDGDRASVIVVHPDDTLEQRTVKLGLQNANYAEIVTGLSDGDQVVISDRGALRPGEHVAPREMDALIYGNKTS
jgi:RND family efflux transporter MFP subunit